MQTINSNNTAIILGNSPFLNEVVGEFQYVISRFYTLGINEMGTNYPVNVHISTDLNKALKLNTSESVKEVTLAKYGDLIQKKNKELIDTFSFQIDKETELYKGGKLAWCGFTHDYAVSYCIYKGFENIILLASADFSQGAHFSHGQSFLPHATLKHDSIQFISDVCTGHANIYTCNPNSALDIPRISMQSLLT